MTYCQLDKYVQQKLWCQSFLEGLEHINKHQQRRTFSLRQPEKSNEMMLRQDLWTHTHTHTHTHTVCVCVCVCVIHSRSAAGLFQDSQMFPYREGSELIVTDLWVGLRSLTHHTPGQRGHNSSTYTRTYSMLGKQGLHVKGNNYQN